MTPIEKAAQEALDEITNDISGRSGLGDILDQIEDDVKDEMKATHLGIITKHLAPVQAELDAKDKLLQEASAYVSGYIETLECLIAVMPETDEKVMRFRKLIAKAQDWLARLSKNE